MTRLERKLEEQRAGRRIRRKRVFVVTLLLLAIAMVAGASYLWFGGSLTASGDKEAMLYAKDKVNIMVLGVDERDDDVGRSDTLFVVTVDTKTKQVAMLSIPRDTRVKIPGIGWDKINHAYANGGVKLAQKSVEGLLGIKIDHTIKIAPRGFVKVIDSLGGLDINVEKRMYYTDPYDDNGGLVIDLRPGLQHLDGQKAVQYVRYRDEEGDIGRVARQQHFIKALLAEAASPSTIVKIPSLIKDLSSVVKTDMSVSEMVDLAKIISDASKNGLKADMVPGKPGYINDISYWLPNLVELRQHVANTLGVTMEDKHLAATSKEAAEYETSIPKEMKVVETPKTKDTTDPKAKTPEKPGDPKKPLDPKKPGADSANASGKVRIEVVNVSGEDGAGAKMATLLRQQGFEVVSVSGSGGGTKNTTVVANGTATANKLSGLPFRYTMQVNQSGGSSDAVVMVGKDFVNK
ncbi:LCP family protein [Azotosporobacter soli]|uniref:LCP family protein n=1 Tax=Azotosporobacter soli TaxID=3055040 RepID=UPI0031FE660A